MLICITNRKLCKGDFLERISKLASGVPHAIMLREKDLSLAEYEHLAERVNDICSAYDVSLIINQNISSAIKLKVPNIHLSMVNLRRFNDELGAFNKIGASVHSLEEALEAEKLGATYLIAGHLFLTDSKKGLPGRGLSFLKEVCDAVTIPVFAIGGITMGRVKDVTKTGAAGVCIMSEAMTCEDPSELKGRFSCFN